MNVNDLRNGGKMTGETNIVDPNLQRKMNKKSERVIVSAEDLGIQDAPTAPLQTATDALLDKAKIAIHRKQQEAMLMADAISQTEDGITEEEFNDILESQRAALASDSIPTVQSSTAPSDVTYQDTPKEAPAYSYHEEVQNNTTSDIQSELDALDKEYSDQEEESEDYNEDYDDVPGESPDFDEDDNSENTSDYDINENTANNAKYQAESVDFEKELEALLDDSKKSNAEKEEEERTEKLKKAIRDKIKPVTDKLDITTFTVVNKPAPSNNVISMAKAREESVVDWVLMNSGRAISMRKFKGSELERLSNGGKGRTRLNKEIDKWSMIYDHIVDPHKPDNLESWAKTISFLDIDNIYMAIYKACFNGANFIPYTCTQKGCNEVFLSDDLDIMDMVKFKDEESKERFYKILNRESKASDGLYESEIVPVSDDYAFAFREPSIYNIIFETAVLDESFAEKYGDLISIVAYIDNIYYINKQTHELQPVRLNTFKNNVAKTTKAKILKYAQIISELTSDQYNTIIAYMRHINELGESVTYRIPEVTCPKCKTKIKEAVTYAESLVFTRHQLAALASL